VIVVEGNIIKNEIIDVEQLLDDETLLKLNILLNTNLNGLSIEEISLGTIQKMKEQAGIHSEVISNVIDAVGEAIKADEDLEIYTSGANNIFRYPELSDHERASEIISAFEEKKQLSDIVYETLSNQDGDSSGIQVFIGEESPVQNMKDCSVVTATYELEEGMQGTIGIIGPKRMDYDKVVKTLKSLTSQLDSIYKKKDKKVKKTDG
jgi:heat-inducible transcriptional repressor